MSDAEKQELVGPDFSQGIDAGSLGDGQKLLGHFEGEPVLVARHAGEIFAIGAKCSHYGGPLGEGVIVGDSVRCPWHHACFSLRTGEVLAAPALDPVPCYAVETRGPRLFVIGKKPGSKKQLATAAAGAGPIVIVGGGAAGHAAAETLRREGYDGDLTLVSADPSPPVDRPNLSKDYLAGNAPEEWIPLRPPEFFRERRIELLLGTAVETIEVEKRSVTLAGGRALPYRSLLLATGSTPVKLDVPGADGARVHYLRTLADARAIIAAVPGAKRAVVLGASFIGLEVAASLRARGLEVHVAAPSARPFEHVLGPELGAFFQRVHEEQGVVFHMGRKARAITNDAVELDDGQRLAADLVIAGIGVRPALGLAESAGLTIDRGVMVDRFLRTSAPGIFAAGDIARWPDFRTGASLRVEHWVVAERLGEIAARNMLDQEQPCRIVPFFWTQQYDVGLHYVGSAERWDKVEIEGDPTQRDCRVRYRLGGKTLAVVTIGRDLESLEAELELESA